MTDKPANLREALERELDGGLQGMRYDLNGYPTLALPKARLLEILRLYAGELTAAEVKVLTETARQETADRIAAEADRIAERYQAAANEHRALSIEHRASVKRSESHFKTALAFKNKADGAWAIAQIARDLPPQAPSTASDATSGVGESSEVGSESQAVSNRLPQEPCGHPTCPCASQEAR